jgi:hypothetical protein
MTLAKDPMVGDASDYQKSTSHAGMAHFAGTGPLGAKCQTCKHFRLHHRILSSGYCAQFEHMIEHVIKGALVRHFFPGATASCKYWEGR